MLQINKYNVKKGQVYSFVNKFNYHFFYKIIDSTEKSVFVVNPEFAAAAVASGKVCQRIRLSWNTFNKIMEDCQGEYVGETIKETVSLTTK